MFITYGPFALCMPTTKKHIEEMIIWSENQILNDEKCVRDTLNRIKDLEYFQRNLKIKLNDMEMV